MSDRKELSRAQIHMLETLAEDDSTHVLGTSSRGTHASNWFRTVTVLVREGFATRYLNTATITEEGRRFLDEQSIRGKYL